MIVCFIVPQVWLFYILIEYVFILIFIYKYMQMVIIVGTVFTLLTREN